MKYDVKKIRELVKLVPDTKFIYFWGHTPNPKKITASCLSQWYDCRFEVEGVIYHTTEQYMMARKALLFNDEEIYRRIMSARTPAEYKKLGRAVRGFEAAKWDARKYDIVVEGNKAKFGQNPDLRDFLLSTGNAILVEASPYDSIWGIALDRERAMTGTPEQWKGENLLGFALMETRDALRNENN